MSSTKKRRVTSYSLHSRSKGTVHVDTEHCLGCRGCSCFVYTDVQDYIELGCTRGHYICLRCFRKQVAAGGGCINHIKCPACGEETNLYTVHYVSFRKSRSGSTIRTQSEDYYKIEDAGGEMDPMWYYYKNI